MKSLIPAIFVIFAATGTLAQSELEVTQFREAERAVRAGDWSLALARAEAVGPVARDIFEWQRLRAGRGDFESVLRFLERRSDWPGLQLLRRRSEKSVPFAARADEVIAFFAGEPPQTGGGATALIEAYRAKGMMADAEAEAVKAWLSLPLSAKDEAVILARFGEELEQHHAARLDMLLWRNLEDEARRMYPRVNDGLERLAEARLALRANRDGVDGLIEKVPAEYADDAGLAFERMQWRARKGRNEAAIELMLERDVDTLGRPESWASWRRSFARAEMRAGRIDRAYRLAANHGLTEGSNYSDLEWLAGYLALTYKDDPALALRHFTDFRQAVFTPISLGRAGYWLGRAHEALGDAGKAQEAYAFGAGYQTSFYGLLAAEKAGMPMDPALTGREDYPPWRATSFADSSVFEAARLFIATGNRNRAEQFLTHLTEGLDETEIGSLGDFVVSVDEPHLAVMIGKQAARGGKTVVAPYYPTPSLGPFSLPVPEELALAIARRESEFDPVVMSGVGARGLMQLMPGTAREVAAYLELPYNRERLITDPVYNARLGTAYLDELMQTFDGNVVMVSAGYNAGPGRPYQWMQRRGDPRRGEVDIVDWIEHIPFRETRNYVMRVTESLPVYRARLTGTTAPLAFSDELIATPGHLRQAAKGRLVRPIARPAVLTD